MEKPGRMNGNSREIKIETVDKYEVRTTEHLSVSRNLVGTESSYLKLAIFYSRLQT